MKENLDGEKERRNNLIIWNLMPSASTREKSQTHALEPGHVALREVKGPIKKFTLWLKRLLGVQFQAGTAKSKARNPGFCV